MMRSPSHHARRAFTLFEVILAIALVTMLSSAVFGFVWNLLDRREALLSATRDVHATEALFERLESDMLGAIVAGSSGESGGGGGGGGDAAGIQGDSESLRILARTVLLPARPTEAQPVLADLMGDLQSTHYSFDSSTGTLTVKRTSVNGGGGGRAGQAADVLSNRIARLRFRYFDGREWRSEFDTLKETKLLTALEVAIWFKGLAPEPEAAAAATADSNTADKDANSTAGPRPAKATEDSDADDETHRRWPPPDRLRIIVVPDGPDAGWARSATSADRSAEGGRP